jgi:hypothetical protein
VTLSHWRCRLCGFDRYHRVSVLQKMGVRYQTPFATARSYGCYDGPLP